MATSPTFPADPVVDSDTCGGLLTVLPFTIADAASADYDFPIDHKLEVVGVRVQKRGGDGGAANTVQVKNLGNAISDAISINITQDAIARSVVNTFANAVIDPAAGGKIRISVVKAGGNAACFVLVECIKRN